MSLKKIHVIKKQGGCSPPIKLKHKIPGYDYFENFELCSLGGLVLLVSPPSVKRYLHFLNSCHKEVVHVCLIKISQSLSHVQRRTSPPSSVYT